MKEDRQRQTEAEHAGTFPAQVHGDETDCRPPHHRDVGPADAPHRFVRQVHRQQREELHLREISPEISEPNHVGRHSKQDRCHRADVPIKPLPSDVREQHQR